jgi:glycosyltransferase involved in cell wall biosynthesis
VHLISPLVRAGWEVTVAYEKLSNDFESPLGVKLMHWSEIVAFEKAAYDLCIMRCYPKGFSAFIKSVRRNGGTVIQYDQAKARLSPIGFGLELARALKRLTAGRPLKRITPVTSVSGAKVSILGLCESFRYPFDSNSIIAAANESDFGLPPSTEASEPSISIVTVAKSGQSRKRVDNLLKALSMSAIRFRLILISSGVPFLNGPKFLKPIFHLRSNLYLDRIQKLEASMTGRVEVVRLNDLSHRDTLSAIASADVFALPSVREPFSISPLEAAGLGKPVFLTTSNGVTQYIEPTHPNLIVSASKFSREASRMLEKIFRELRFETGNREGKGIRNVATSLEWLNFLEGLMLPHRGS